MARTTITGTRGQQLPDLQAHGLAKQMKPAAKLIDEQDRLRRRATELGTERQRLEAEIKQRERELTRQWGQAIRSGEEAPTEKGIERAKKRLEALRGEISAVRHAGDLADAELREAVAEHREEWDAAVSSKAEKILSEAQEIADALSRKLSETEGLVGVHSWLRSSGQNYTPASPTALSIEHILHERRRELGLLDVGVIG
jgi:chromosome segregation ATPase